VPVAAEKVATKSIAGQGGAACLMRETGTGMGVEEPEKNKRRKKLVYIFLT